MDLQYVFGNPKKGKAGRKKSRPIAKKKKSGRLKAKRGKHMARKGKKKVSRRVGKKRNPAIIEVIDTRTGSKKGGIGSVKRSVRKAPTKKELKQLKQIWKNRTKRIKGSSEAEVGDIVAKNRKTQARIVQGKKEQKKFVRLARAVKSLRAKGNNRYQARYSKSEERIEDQGDTVASSRGKLGAMARRKKKASKKRVSKRKSKKRVSKRKASKASKKAARKAKRKSYKRKSRKKSYKKVSRKSRKKRSSKRRSKRSKRSKVHVLSTAKSAKRFASGKISSLKKKKSVRFKIGKKKKAKSFFLKRLNPFGGNMLGKVSKVAEASLQHSFAEAGSLAVAGATHRTVDAYGRMLLSYIPMSDKVLSLPVIGPAVPNLIVAGIIGYLADKFAPAGTAKKLAQSYAKSLAATSIIAAGESLGQVAGLAGIIYTPRMSGVKYFPKAMSGVEYFPLSGGAGMGYADASEQGQLGDAADFGSADFGPGGFSERHQSSDADFGGEEYDPVEGAHLG